MKGNNKLILNTATMIEIVQRWVDAEMPNIAKGQKVAGVVSSLQGCGTDFEVRLSDKEMKE